MAARGGQWTPPPPAQPTDGKRGSRVLPWGAPRPKPSASRRGGRTGVKMGIRIGGGESVLTSPGFAGM